MKYLTNATIVPQSNKISPNQIYICHLSSIIFSTSYVRTILLLRVEDAPDSSNFHFHLREEKEKLSSTRRDLLTDSITDSLKLRGIFIVGHECKLPVGSGILAVLIIFKRVGGNLNWKFLLPPPPSLTTPLIFPASNNNGPSDAERCPTNYDLKLFNIPSWFFVVSLRNIVFLGLFFTSILFQKNSERVGNNSILLNRFLN